MNKTSHIEQQAADWLARKDSEHWSEQDQCALNTWIDESTSHRLAYLRLKNLWQRADRLHSLRPQATATASLQTSSLLVTETQQPAAGWIESISTAANDFPWRSLAAAFIVCTCAAFLMFAPSDRHKAEFTYATAVGKRQAVTLTDGSHLTLNTNTKMAINLGAQARHVRLEQGEAFFEVVHDATRPFTVDAGKSRITVLGTKFSVKRNGDQVSVLVKEGRVKVEPLSSGNTTTATIGRNDELVAANNSFIVAKKSEEQVVNQLSWRQGQLAFDQVTLGQAASEFNRYNQQKLIIADTEVAKITIGGRFESNNVVSFARLLHEGLGLQVETHANEIRVTRQ